MDYFFFHFDIIFRFVLGNNYVDLDSYHNVSNEKDRLDLGKTGKSNEYKKSTIYKYSVVGSFSIVSYYFDQQNVSEMDVYSCVLFRCMWPVDRISNE